MVLPLQQRAVNAVELMDDPQCDPRSLTNTYRQFGLVNRLFAGWRGLYQRELAPLLRLNQGPSAPLRVLDVGCGGGDLPVLLAKWAAQDGCAVDITGIDPDPRAAAFAATRPVLPGVTFRAAHSADLVAAGDTFDVVISNHVLHHLAAPELAALLADSAALAGRLVLHNDLRRSVAAYGLFSAAALPFRGSFIRADGLTSIRRSYTPAELAAAAPAGWSVARVPLFHQALVLRKGYAGAR